MGTEDDRAASALDDLLNRAVRQGYLDPMTGRAARSGVDRLRTFLSGDGTQPDTGAQPGQAAGSGGQAATGAAGGATGRLSTEKTPAAPAAEEPAPDGEGTTRIPVALRGGRRAELVLPERFDREDAARVASVLHALALDEDDQPPTA